MCGIHALIEFVKSPPTSDNPISEKTEYLGSSTSNGQVDPISAVLRRRLCDRGPDHLGQAAVAYDPSPGQHRIELRFTSTVLALRGGGLTPQPFVDAASGSVLCWNGEAWKLGSRDGSRDDILGNDGSQLFELLKEASSASRDAKSDAILDVLRAVEGPFAFVYFDLPAGQLYYGRDRLGRRSLLVHATKSQLTLSSVSDVSSGDMGANAWTEVEADGIYVVDLESACSTGLDTPIVDLSSRISRYDWTTHQATDPYMVSGLGLFNMTTDPPSDITRLTLDSPSVQCLRDCLVEALRLRVLNVPKPPVPTVAPIDDSSPTIPDTRVAILFSGGLDCAVLARMSHELIPVDQGIDLINVAFENPRVAAHLAPGVTNVYEACPDRITGRKSFAELQRVCPGRAWRFIAANISYKENLKHRPEIVSLMYPHGTEMDLSIASALYFAARGAGVACDSAGGTATETDSMPYTTPARVLLSGLGADELFGGYGRHSVAFAARGGYTGLAEELRLDVARLGQRNLGRDDRVFAHWGREVRFPFLDEALVRWAIALPVWEKCDFANVHGEGSGGVEPAKRVLRLVALNLGMVGVAQEKKRAFGARTAKMESGRVKGTALVT